MYRTPALIAILLAAGTASAAETPSLTLKEQARLDKRLAGKTPGEPLDCIDPKQTSEMETVGDSVLLYKRGARLTYRNDLIGSCAGLRHGDPLVTVSVGGGRLCRGDMAQTRSPVGGVMTGSCALGKFVPYAGSK